MKYYRILFLPVLTVLMCFFTACDRGGSEKEELLESEDNSTMKSDTPQTSTDQSKAKSSSKSSPKTPGSSSKSKGKAKASAPKSEIDRLVEQRYPMPEIRSLAEITQNWSNVPSNAYPPQVVASVPVPFQLVLNGQVAGSSNTPPGSPLTPLRLVNGQLLVSKLGNRSMQTQIPVEQTNFKQLIEQKYNEGVNRIKSQIADRRAKAKQALLAQPDRLASLTNSGPADSSSDPRFAPVKASIQRGEAHPASLEEAKSFKWNGSERINGEIRGTYDTVSVHFEVSTIFGKFPTDYKCLLQGGKVVGWIDPITQEKITKN